MTALRLPTAANSNGACDLAGPCPCREGRCPMAQKGGSEYQPGQFVAMIEELRRQYAAARVPQDAGRRRPARPRPQLVE